MANKSENKKIKQREMNKMDVKILVATHKSYKMPKDEMYLPVYVGAEGKETIGFQGDNQGDNISESNPRLCELTAIYWAWKNLKADYIGLVHYRRHFTQLSFWNRAGKNKFDCVLSKEELERVMKDTDAIVPNKRKYYIESIQSHFLHLPYTYEKDLKILENTIRNISPEYMEAFEIVMERSWAHMFNMFVMKKELFDEYCSWMFPILLEADKRIDVSDYTPMEKRAVAYFGEFMLDIWMEKNKIPYKEVKVMFMEKQNWIVKSWNFIVRKFIHRKL